MILRWLGFGRKVASAKAKLMYKPTTVRLFIKPFCGWCDEVMEWLDRNKIKYISLDVTSDRAAWDEMVRLSRQSSAPRKCSSLKDWAQLGVASSDVPAPSHPALRGRARSRSGSRPSSDA